MYAVRLIYFVAFGEMMKRSLAFSVYRHTHQRAQMHAETHTDSAWQVCGFSFSFLLFWKAVKEKSKSWTGSTHVTEATSSFFYTHPNCSSRHSFVVQAVGKCALEALQQTSTQTWLSYQSTHSHIWLIVLEVLMIPSCSLSGSSFCGASQLVSCIYLLHYVAGFIFRLL